MVRVARLRVASGCEVDRELVVGLKGGSGVLR